MAAPPEVVGYGAARKEVVDDRGIVLIGEVPGDAIAAGLLKFILEARGVARVLPGIETLAGGVLGRLRAVAFVEAVEEREDSLLERRLT